MKVIIRFPYKKEMEVKGSLTLAELLAKLELGFSSVLVMRDYKFLLNDPNCLLGEDDFIEIFPPLAGG